MLNPNESLLPQPPVPAPIVPMSGGGMVGGGAEHVSLLEQPSVAVNIVPVRGGGGGGGGTMVGGGVFPTLSLKAMKQVQIAAELDIFLTVSIMAAYREKRKAIWPVIPANYEESRANLFHYEIKTKEIYLHFIF